MEEEEDVLLEEENMEADLQMELKGGEEDREEGAVVSAGISRRAESTHPPDEEQAGF